MKTTLRLNERGIAHLGMIVLIALVVAVGYFAYVRVSNSDDTTNNKSTAVTSDEEQAAQDNASIEADNNAAQNQSSANSVNTQEQSDGIQ